VNTGEVVVRSIKTDDEHTEYTPIGHSTSLAARMEALAPIGSIATTEQVHRLCEGYFAFKDLGSTRVKGVSEQVHVYDVTGIGPLRTHFQRSTRRGLTKFVGREAETAAIARAAELAKSGHGQIVGVVAEPGVGKSRLFYEFKLRNQSGWLVLEAYSVSHGRASAYLPVIDLLHSYFRIAPDDDTRTRREKATGRLLALDRALEDALPYLFGPLGLIEGDDPLAQMDPQIRRRRTLDGIKRILLRESMNQPLMVMFEDLHWIDEETQALLDLLTDSIGSSQVLMLVNYRPEYHHDWGNRVSHTQLRLEPLGRESAEEMLTALLGDPVEVTPLKRLIIEKTEGTPLFIEETIQMLFEEGALVRNGQVKIARSLSGLSIPSTVQAILASRIDRLSAAEKQLLQTLAVLGIEFPLKLAAQVAGKQEEELLAMLASLQQREFIYEQLGDGDLAYTFKHALTHDVAYNSVLMERRRQLHERTGVALETLYASSIDDHLVELAHHYSRTNNPDKAVEYHGRAAQQALSRSAFNEALSLGRAGLALVPELAVSAERSRREFSLLSTLVRAASAIEGYGSQQTAIGSRRMLEIARELGDDGRLFTALYGMWMEHNIAARHQEAMELAGQMVREAERRSSPPALADALSAQGWTLFCTGHNGDALAALNRALAICGDGAGRTSADGNDPFVWSLVCTAVSAWVAGYPARALSVSESAVNRARDLKQPLSLAFALFYQPWVRSWRGEVNATSDCCDRLEALVENGGIASFLGLNRINQGWGSRHARRTHAGCQLDSQRHRKLGSECVHLSQFNPCGGLDAGRPSSGGGRRGFRRPRLRAANWGASWRVRDRAHRRRAFDASGCCE
jgi:hypothetical protein